jgi:hypothetical protein
VRHSSMPKPCLSHSAQVPAPCGKNPRGWSSASLVHATRRG